MSKRPLNVKLLSSLLMAGTLVLAGCSDNDYDFNQIDATIGIGGDGLEIPASSTEDIKLKDVLDLEEDGSVVEDATTHDYVFRQNGDPISPITVNIEKIQVAKQHGESLPFSFEMPSGAKHTRSALGAITANSDIYTFTYNGERPREVVDLVKADASTVLSLNVPLQSISSAVSTLQSVKLTLPDYITFDMGACSTAPSNVSGSTISFTNVPTNKTFSVKVNVKSLDFKKAGTSKNKIELTDKNIRLVGTIHLSASGEINNIPTSPLPEINVDFGMDNFTINAATGRFNPDINMNEGLGSTTISGIPEFLQDDNVRVDLYNPQILLTIGNDMEADGTITGKIVSKKKGVVIQTIDNIIIPVEGNKENKICINRTGEAKEGYTVVKKEDLSKAIEIIPDEITFEATAKANSEKVITFLLGHDYHITPAYSIDAPLAFAKNAEIVYKDTLDGWNDDIKDMELATDAYISATAYADNGVPVYLTIDASPVDINKQPVDGINIELLQKDVKASANGVDKATSLLEIKITQTKKGAMKNLDGIIFTATGKATDSEGNSVTGVTLNAEKHNLKIRDIRIKVVGKVIGDFN